MCERRDMQNKPSYSYQIIDAPKRKSAEITPTMVVNTGSEAESDFGDEPVWVCRDPEPPPTVAVPAGRVYRTDDVMVWKNESSVSRTFEIAGLDTYLDDDHLTSIRFGTSRALGQSDEDNATSRLLLRIRCRNGDHLRFPACARSRSGGIRHSQNHLFNSLQGRVINPLSSTTALNSPAR